MVWSPDLLADAIVAPELRQVILAAATIEGETTAELKKASRAGLMKHEDLRRFFELWIVEEQEHARVLRFVAGQNGWSPLQDLDVLSVRQRLRQHASPVGLYASRLFVDSTSAMLGVAAAAEYVTHILYRSLARRVEHSELKRCLFRMAAQESNHLKFFMAAASARPSPGGLQAAAVRKGLKTVWQPVGMDRIGLSAWNATFESLLEETSLSDELVRMDDLLDSIDTFKGLGLMQGFLDRGLPSL